MEAHRSMVTNSQVKLPTSPAINNLSIPFISKRMFPLVHTFTEWITLQKSYHETASVSVPHLISCASHSATKATSLKYGERQSPSGKSSFSQWKGTALVPSPLWLLPFFIHAIMHIHFKRIFAIHYPGFPCVLCNEVFWLFRSLLSPEMEVQEQFSRVTRALPACMLSRFSRIQLFETLWATACQAPLSTKFSRQEHWSELSCPPPRDLPHPEMEPKSLTFPALTGRLFTTSASRTRNQARSPQVTFNFDFGNDSLTPPTEQGGGGSLVAQW